MRPLFFIRLARCVAFIPGAEHMSSTTDFFGGFSRYVGTRQALFCKKNLESKCSARAQYAFEQFGNTSRSLKWKSTMYSLSLRFRTRFRNAW
uniref:Putative secreted protein n=1 Tax=Anopheles triannulatus TaxID=58253 RepID=A0A2M4B6H2_9DIPT